MTLEEAVEILKKYIGCKTDLGKECLKYNYCGECCYYFTELEWEKALEATISALEKRQWIPCTPTTMPEANVEVIMQCRGKNFQNEYRYFQVIGTYIPPLTVKVEEKWSDPCDIYDLEVYDEKTDTYYCKDGWYEETTQGDGDNVSWYMTAEVIAWMPKPETYKGD